MEPIEVCNSEVAYSAGTERSHSDAPEHGNSEQAFVRGLIDGMRCGILAVDRQLRLVMINEPAREILELDSPPPSGVPVAEALGAFPQLINLVCDSFSMASLPNRAELELEPEKSHGKTIGFTVSMIPGHATEPLGAAIFFKDLTQIEHKEEQERLKDRLAAVGQMAASLAHEIRNPLASIEVQCSLLKRRLDDDAASRLLNKVTAEIRRLNDTITSCLEFVRPVASTLEYAELRPVLEHALDVAFERCGADGIEVGLDVGDGMQPFLMDRGQLRQVFENLLINAMEAGGPGGRISVEIESIPADSTASIPYEPSGASPRDPWREFENVAVIRISDNGPGIPEDDRERVFFPFFTTKKQGSGVGLSMVKKIVDSHRGLIDVSGAPEGGALFTVRLPMVLQAAED